MRELTILLEKGRKLRKWGIQIRPSKSTPIPVALGAILGATRTALISWQQNMLSAAEIRAAQPKALQEILTDPAFVHAIAARFPFERVTEAHEGVGSGMLIGNVEIDL